MELKELKGWTMHQLPPDFFDTPPEPGPLELPLPFTPPYKLAWKRTASGKTVTITDANSRRFGGFRSAQHAHYWAKVAPKGVLRVLIGVRIRCTDPLPPRHLQPGELLVSLTGSFSYTHLPEPSPEPTPAVATEA